jgi:hypothetical protein
VPEPCNSLHDHIHRKEDPRQPDPGTQPGRYRCSLPGLTGFTAGCRGGTDADLRYFTSLFLVVRFMCRSGRSPSSQGLEPFERAVNSELRCAPTALVCRASDESRRGGRAVEGARLESVYTPKRRIEGSNPSLSAKRNVIADRDAQAREQESLRELWPPRLLSSRKRVYAAIRQNTNVRLRN